LQRPEMLFTYIPTSGRSSLRGLETLMPMSIELNIPIFTYKSVDYIRMLEDIKSRVCGRTILIAWHHNPPGIRDIVFELGVSEDIVSAFFMLYAEDYDVVWTIDYVRDGTIFVANLTIKFQGLGNDPCNVE